MRGVLVTHLPLFVDKGGEVLREPAGLQGLGEFLASVVAVGTRTAAGKRPGRVACRCHVADGPCPGVIRAAVEAHPSRVEWWCPVCSDSGVITGWERTRWDRTRLVGRKAARKTAKKKQRSRAA